MKEDWDFRRNIIDVVAGLVVSGYTWYNGMYGWALVAYLYAVYYVWQIIVQATETYEEKE